VIYEEEKRFVIAYLLHCI